MGKCGRILYFIFYKVIDVNLDNIGEIGLLSLLMIYF